MIDFAVFDPLLQEYTSIWKTQVRLTIDRPTRRRWLRVVTVAEIPEIIHKLTQGPPSTQEKTLMEYFTPDAEFIHPLCRVRRGPYSRLLILAVYQWYKILSPRIELEVNSVGQCLLDHGKMRCCMLRP